MPSLKASTPFSFSKEERLSKKKLIDELFKNGSSFYLQPFRVLFLEMKSPAGNSTDYIYPAQVLIAVPAKTFKKAVDRNKIKRLIREAYRLNKHLLYQSLLHHEKYLLLGFLYTAQKIESFSFIQEKMISVLKKLAAQNEVAQKDSD